MIYFQRQSHRSITKVIIRSPYINQNSKIVKKKLKKNDFKIY